MTMAPEMTLDYFNRLGQDYLPGHLGLRITAVGEGLLCAEVDVQQHLLAPNGFLHAASVVALADTAAGYACAANLPAGARSFTTIELKCNFIGTATEGTVCCEARAVHLGRSSQLWDVTVHAKGQERPIALFRCTQMVLWPKTQP